MLKASLVIFHIFMFILGNYYYHYPGIARTGKVDIPKMDTHAHFYQCLSLYFYAKYAIHTPPLVVVIGFKCNKSSFRSSSKTNNNIFLSSRQNLNTFPNWFQGGLIFKRKIWMIYSPSIFLCVCMCVYVCVCVCVCVCVRGQKKYHSALPTAPFLGTVDPRKLRNPPVREHILQ